MNATGTPTTWLRESLARAIERERAGASPPDTDAGACRIVKSEPGTLVWRDRRATDDAAVVCKLYRHGSPLKHLRDRLARSPAEREYAVLTRLHRAGIPCSEPLAWACGIAPETGAYSLLATREIPHAETLEQLAARDAGALNAVNLPALIRIVRHMHACGVYHGALAPRNILLQTTATGADAFFLIDTRRSLIFPYDIASCRMGQRDLLWLCMYIVRYMGAARIPELLAAAGLAPDAVRRFMRILAAQRSSRGRRNLVNTEFSLRAWLANRGVPPGDDWLRLRLPDRPGCRLDLFYRLDAPEWRTLGARYWRNELPGLATVKQHAWGGITQCGMLPEANGRFYFKRFAITGARYLHKPPRARHTVVHQAALRVLGFDTPDVVCLIERRCLGLLTASAIVTADLGNATFSLNSIVNCGAGNLIPAHDERRQLLRALGSAVGRRHAAGLFHGDLHLGNIFARRADGGFQFFWIDNEEGQRYHRLPMRRRLHDLDHINRFRHRVSLSERMLVWKAYAATAGIPPDAQRRIQRRTMRKSRRFWQKKGWL
jgi:tRNA A-37 threonylcarbamoyl transferase component Bud32